MTARDYFILALNQGLYKHIEWINDAFAVVEHIDGMTHTAGYSPKLLRKGNTLTTEIEGEVVTFELENLRPLVSFWDPLELAPGELPTVVEGVTTTYGEALYNMYVLYNAFGTQFPYQAGRLTDGRLEDLIAPHVKDDPEEPYETNPSLRPKGEIYATDLKRFFDSQSALTATNRLTVPSMSDKALTVNPAIIAKRDEELARLKAQGEISTEDAIRLENELSAMDKEDFKGDESEGFYINPGKSFGNTRKKSHVMMGLETDFNDPSKQTLIEHSLQEGLQVEHWAEYNNSARSGSFSRGALTALAGQSAKEAMRATQDLKITDHDCGTTETIPFFVNRQHIKDKLLVGRYHVVGAKLKVITLDDFKQMEGQTLKLRDPQRCKMGPVFFCELCCGQALSATPTAVGAEITEVNNVFMNTMMKAMHNAGLQLAHFDPNLYIS